jgi:hypothetical protein
MATTEAIAATADAATATVACSGPTTFVITPKILKPGEYVRLLGENPAGAFTDELFRFSHLSKESVLIETYRGVQVNKTATATALAIHYGAPA